MTLSTILLIILILLLIGAAPAWPHSRNWGYGPSGGLGLIVVIILIIIFFLFGAERLPEMGKGIGEGIKNFKDR